MRIDAGGRWPQSRQQGRAGGLAPWGGCVSSGKDDRPRGQTVEESQHGLAFGSLETFFSLAMALAGQAAGLLYARTSSHTLPLVAGLAGLPIIAGLWFVVRPQRHPLARPVEALASGGE